MSGDRFRFINVQSSEANVLQVVFTSRQNCKHSTYARFKLNTHVLTTLKSLIFEDIVGWFMFSYLNRLSCPIMRI